jgi:hypothetical protein
LCPENGRSPLVVSAKGDRGTADSSQDEPVDLGIETANAASNAIQANRCPGSPRRPRVENPLSPAYAHDFFLFRIHLGMFRTSLSIRVAATLVALVLTLAGCSRVGIAYNTGDFLLKGYAKDYLDLESSQLSGWEPVLTAELTRHRAEELPYLAAYVDRILTASQVGFDKRNTACITKEFREIYRRQAKFAVTLAAPLLAELTPSQIQRLENRFRDEATEDRAKLSQRSEALQQQKRTRRYVKAIEDWTGPLDAEQQLIVADITARMPSNRASLLDYRTLKRDQLIAMLKSNADAREIDRFLTDWLVELNDLPADLERSGQKMGKRIAELLVRLGASLDAGQRERLHKRLREVRDDLMNLQKQPHMAPMTC